MDCTRFVPPLWKPDNPPAPRPCLYHIQGHPKHGILANKPPPKCTPTTASALTFSLQPQHLCPSSRADQLPQPLTQPTSYPYLHHLPLPLLITTPTHSTRLNLPARNSLNKLRPQTQTETRTTRSCLTLLCLRSRKTIASLLVSRSDICGDADDVS